MLATNTVDIAISQFGITEERKEVVEYMHFNEIVQGRIYIRNPKDAIDLEIYTKPFASETWIGVSLILALVPILLMLVMFHCKETWLLRYYNPTNECIIIKFTTCFL